MNLHNITIEEMENAVMLFAIATGTATEEEIQAYEKKLEAEGIIDLHPWPEDY